MPDIPNDTHARTIRDYWHHLGFDNVQVAVQTATFAIRDMTVMTVIRSNLIAGLPPGCDALKLKKAQRYAGMVVRRGA